MWLVRFVVAVMPVCALSGCQTPATAAGQAMLRVLGAEKTEGPVHGVLDLKIYLEVQNSGVHQIYYHPCGAVLERSELEAVWSHVWGASCTLMATDPLADALEIAPGQTRETTIRVVAYPSEFRWPSVGLNGQYRIRAVLTDARMRKLPVQMSTTSGFPMPQN